MKQDFASIVNFIMKYVGHKANATAYFENVKSGFSLPAIYFPEPECSVQKDTLSCQYMQSNMLFVQIFHLNNDYAYNLAKQIVDAFFKTGCYIPLINEDGSETSLFLHLNVKKVSRIDDCVAQVQLFWNYNSSYRKERTKVNNINLNLMTEGESYGKDKS